MSSFDFTIILVNWNTAEMLLEAIASVQAEAAHSTLSCEIIVVDNGSSDESVSRVKQVYPAIQVIEMGYNSGFARAVNRGLANRQGRHVLLLNTDARLKAGALTAFAKAFGPDSRIGIAGGRLLKEDGSAQNTAAPFPTLLTELINKSLLGLVGCSSHPRKLEANQTQALEVDSVIGASLAIREETLRQIGPLDERFFFFFEETDWCTRARLAGWQVAVLPDAVVIHGQGKSSEKVLSDVRIEFFRSRYRFFLKHHGRLQTTLLFLGLMIKLVVENISALLMVILSAGRNQKSRRRLSVVSRVLGWHLLGCPGSMGLEGRFLRKI
jgi:GT2 family glycosyltransferase